jgi:hypothetical protein
MVTKAGVDVERARNCSGAGCPTLLSTAATAATLDLKVGGTVDDAALRITIATTGDNYFNTPHYVNLRVNGFGVTLCAGEIDRVRVDKPPTFDVLESSCALRAKDPGHKNDLQTAELARLVVEPVSVLPKAQTVNNTITAYIPRRSGSQRIEASWRCLCSC